MKKFNRISISKSAASIIVLGFLATEFVAVAQEVEGGTEASTDAVEQTDPATDEQAKQLGVVYVTARKREEREIDVPVAISALPSVEIDQRGLTNLSEISTAIPELRIAENTIGYGGNLTMRGISSSTNTASVDQAVTVNIDGVPVSYAGVVKLGQFDLGQVEVLKGPQALFFGKNATGGIVSLTSAAPTEELDYRMRGEYEAEAAQYAGEAYISGPLSEGVRGRLAVRYSDSEGWLKNVVPDPSVKPGAIPPKNDKGPGIEEFLAKGSLVIEPSSAFTIKLNGGYSDTESTGNYMLSQRIYCPYGQAQGPFAYAGQDCKLNDITTQGDMPGSWASLDPRFPSDGVAYTKTKQQILVADVNYQVTDDISLNSITGFYNVNLDASDHVSNGAVPFVGFATSIEKTTYSQEFRLSNAASNRFTWMLGLFLQDDEYLEDQSTIIGVLRPKADFRITGDTLSPFVQLGFDLTEKLSLTGGVRYTEETKQQQIGTGQFEGLYPKEISFQNWSPEVTLSYALTPDANIYAAYKEAYKSGGFQTEHVAIPGALNAGTALDNSFKEENAEGFEVGAKAYLFDQTLRVSAAAYHFEYTDLQLSSFDSAIVANIIRNVGAATTEGVEMDFQYRPAALEGFSLNGAIAYNDATYDNYSPACYNGQTAALGCDIATDTSDLAGHHLPRAPEWSATLSGVYEGSLSAALDYRLNAGLQYSGEYEGNSDAIPNSEEDGYVSLDAGFAIMDKDKVWELAFIGRNLSDEYWVSSSYQVPVTGSDTTLSDIAATINRGRQLMVRLTYHPQ
ncbi:TonB-dependent receptor [Hyphomonas adhaerens MHS-3]|uniref:TonB-dependent receptor n=1 Tax=Hyphomonas adhaerens MHS-3 TaxID=1280949 RepID=A0A069E7U3_9PROT|nr:TonB-dependent receptor [Hyphomonas adhaerens]KCZ86127.1 TonB-dependent receptor [Hyphomonas adhaerens MHS-3]